MLDDDDDDDDNDDDGTTRRSRLLQFNSNDDDEGDGDDKQQQQQHIRICCVGARAECTLPDDFWREFLIVTNASSTSVASTSTSNSKKFKYTIDFVGPDVPSNLTSKTITLFPNKNDQGGDDTNATSSTGTRSPSSSSSSSDLTLNFHTGYLHEIVLQFLKASSSDRRRTEKIRQFWNGGFALFNPGMGHPNLQKSWEPTLKFLLGSGRPILLTAHSTMDANRDCDVLLNKNVTCGDGSSCLEYEINPYASRMEFVDPFSSLTIVGEERPSRGVHVVRPNHSYLILQ